MMCFNRPLKYAFFLLAVICNSHAFAQAPKKSDSTVVKIAKFKPPVVQTYLGGYTSDTPRIISADEGKNIIGLYLRVTDKKNNKYTITHYGFSYTRVGVTEDEETGAVSPETDMIADDFTTTPLPPVWAKTIQDTLQKGEELHFYDVIVKDIKGRIFYAPDLKFIIQ
jgi:hypothetical protein